MARDRAICFKRPRNVLCAPAKGDASRRRLPNSGRAPDGDALRSAGPSCRHPVFAVSQPAAPAGLEAAPPASRPFPGSHGPAAATVKPARAVLSIASVPHQRSLT